MTKKILIDVYITSPDAPNKSIDFSMVLENNGGTVVLPDDFNEFFSKKLENMIS